jgi:hypothetical protein
MLFLDAITRAQFDRLAHREGYSVTAVIEKLATSAKRRRGNISARL